jgi:hypothetical protein
VQQRGHRDDAGDFASRGSVNCSGRKALKVQRTVSVTHRTVSVTHRMVSKAHRWGPAESGGFREYLGPRLEAPRILLALSPMTARMDRR